MLHDLDRMDSSACYDATSEQVQSWNYHRNLGEKVLHQFLTLDETLPELDTPVFDKAMESMVRRHESLRTFFRVIDGKLMQCIIPYDEELFSPVYFDLSAEENREDTARAVKKITDEYKWSLCKVDAPPLLKCCIFKIYDNTYYLSLIIHHIISDAWSISVMNNELIRIYGCLKNGIQVDAEPLKMQLKDYAAWQKKWLEDNGKAVHDYWENKFNTLGNNFAIEKFHEQSGCLAKLPGANNGRGITMSKQAMLDILNDPKAASYVYLLDPALHSRLTRFSVTCKTGLGAVLHASLLLLFALLKGKERVLLAMPVINRFLPGTDEIIGWLGGGAYLYKPIIQQRSVKEFVREVLEDFQESIGHLIFDHDEMQIDGHALRIHCDVYVNFMNKEIVGNDNNQSAQNRRHRLLENDSPYYALSAYMLESKDSVLSEWKYNLNIYSPEMIEFMVEKHEAILQRICENPEMTIKDLMDSTGTRKPGRLLYI
jgi:rhizoxin biosynthesis, polyketide synthase RhiD